MSLSIPLPRGRQVILFAAALLVSFHALGVLVHVQTASDIGVRCAFRTVIIGVQESYLRNEENQPRPRQGDTILQVGDRDTPTWTHFLRSIGEEGRKDAAGQPGDTHRLVDGEHQVLVRFRPQTEPDNEWGRTCWCRIGPPPLRESVPSALWLMLKFSLFLVGAFVFWKRPDDRSAVLFFWFCILSVGAYMGGYHWARILTQPALLLVFIVCAVLLPVVTLHFFLLFPRPKTFLARRPRWTLATIYGPPLGFLAGMLGCWGYVRDLWQDQAPFDELRSALWLFRTVIYVYLGVAGLWYLGSVVALIHSFRTASDLTERNQVKWLLCGAAVALAPITYTLILAVWKPWDFGSGGATWPMFAASAFFTVAFAISITRYRLMQLDQILSSGVLYFAISTLAGLVYYGVVLVAMVLGTQVMDGPSLQQAVGAGVTVLVLLLVLDLARSRLRRLLDRRFHKEKHQLDRTLRRMGQAIEQLVDPPTLARRLLQASADLLSVTRGAVYLRQPGSQIYQLAGWLGAEPPLNELSPGCPLIEKLDKRGFLIVAARPDASEIPAQRQLQLLGGEVARALSHEGQLLALLVLGPKDPGPYTVEDLNLLGEFAQLTALALESAERRQIIETLNRDLRDKVDKIAEQQRRIGALQTQLQTVAGSASDRLDGVERGLNETADLSPGPPVALCGIVGSSPIMRQLFQLTRKVSASESAVLIRGESGTGKELLARALHEQSPRAGKAFVKVHCAALSPGLLESELFGHVKGAFTSAHRDKVGRFELASGGTLFLDEIGDISLDVQTKLLRVLQEMTFERVGSSDPIEVDVRVIAATHQDLEALIEQGKFREDLYYRLNVISLVVPPLRDRREDIVELALNFLRVCSQKGGQSVTQIDDDALVILKSHDWPGNIRELENVIERAVVVADGPTITVADLPAELVAAVHAAPEHAFLSTEPAEDGTADLLRGLPAERAERDRRERERLVRALASAGGNKAEAARALGLARSTLVSRLKKYGLS